MSCDVTARDSDILHQTKVKTMYLSYYHTGRFARDIQLESSVSMIDARLMKDWIWRTSEMEVWSWWSDGSSMPDTSSYTSKSLRLAHTIWTWSVLLWCDLMLDNVTAVGSWNPNPSLAHMSDINTQLLYIPRWTLDRAFSTPLTL